MAAGSSPLTELLVLAADIGITVFFYKLYQSKCIAANTVADLKQYEIGAELVEKLKESDDGTIPYALVSGFAYSIHTPLKSSFFDILGPIRTFKREMLSSSRNRGVWVDDTATLSSTAEYEPFALHTHAKDFRVLVKDVRNANYLDDALATTYDQFDPSSRSLGGNIYDLLVGHVDKGIKVTERMLKNGMYLIGAGKLALNAKNEVEISEPSVPNSMYILTSLGKEELVKHLKSKAFVFKVLSILFGVTGGIIAWITLRPRIARYVNDIRTRHAMNEIRAQLEEMRQDTVNSDNGSSPGNDGSCVVCLANSRQCVLRPCGHVCICLDCYESLPSPKKCPVCRQSVQDLIPVYLP